MKIDTSVDISSYLNFVKSQSNHSAFFIYFLENTPNIFDNQIFSPRYLDKCNELFQKLFPCFNDQNFISLVDFSFLEEFKSKTSHFLNEKQTLFFQSFFEKIIISKELKTF